MVVQRVTGPILEEVQCRAKDAQPPHRAFDDSHHEPDLWLDVRDRVVKLRITRSDASGQKLPR